jgi:mannose-1-phosphate guanylyltransferase/mannose-6-phosphate isomerase
MIVLPVIIAGGAGTRLWPLSTPERPKPFVDLLGDGTSLFERTVQRAREFSDVTPLVVCNVRHQAFILGVDPLLEPVQRDTAPAVCAAALRAQQLHGDDVAIAIMPADHLVRDTRGFANTMRRAVTVAQTGAIVTIAIPASRAATEFGYLSLQDSRDGFSEVREFIEKPDAARAAVLVASGHLWNGGIFVARADAMLGAFADHAPDILESCKRAAGGETLDEQAFASARKISFDFAVMEKHSAVAAVKAEFDWEDLGNWQAVHAASRLDGERNAVMGDVAVTDCTDTLIRAGMVRIRATSCNDLAVIAHEENVLIMRKQLATGLRNHDALPTFTLPALQSAHLPIPWCGGRIVIENVAGGSLRCVALGFDPELQILGETQ